MRKSRPTSPTGLIILDGFGYSPQDQGNAIAQSDMPHWKRWLYTYPHTLLAAAQEAVGLPKGYIGNSEVGHLTIGAGRAVPSIMSQFDKSIESNTLHESPILQKQLTALVNQSGRLHIMGLASDAGVHAHLDHIIAFLDIAKTYGVKKTYLHLFLDGRDRPPKTAASYLRKIDHAIQDIGIGEIASLHGRYYAMDRDNNWDRTYESYQALTQKGVQVPSWDKALEKLYEHETSEEFLRPIQLTISNGDKGYIQPKDGIICANFRADRATQIIESLIVDNFTTFNRKDYTPSKLLFCITTTRYAKKFSSYNNDILFDAIKPKNTLFNILSQHNKTVYLIAETEKKAHITYFLHGQQNIVLPNETIQLIESRKEKKYNNLPEMSAALITQAIKASLEQNPHDLYVVNYANADMVAHSTDFEATKRACSVLDEQLQKLFEWFVIKGQGTLFITADHGNAEQLLDPHTQAPTSSHSINPVPFMVLNATLKNKTNILNTNNLSLANIAPTLLHFFGIDVPPEMVQERILKC